MSPRRPTLLDARPPSPGRPMTRSLRHAAARARVARAGFLVATGLALATLATFTVVLLVAPASPAAGEHHVLRRGDDYFVYAQPVLDEDDVLDAAWRAAPGQAVPDRVAIVHGSEVARLLAGEAPQGRALEARGDAQPWGGFDAPWEGRIGIRMVERGPDGRYVFPWSGCGGCSDPRPTIVWTRGDAWTGAPLDAFTRGSWAAPDPSAAHPPILLEGVATEHNFDEWAPRLRDAATLAVAAAAALGAWWAIEAALARRDAADPPPPGTDDLLRLVRESERYLDLLGRQLLLGGLVLLLALGLLAFAGLPPILDAAEAHFADPYYAYVLVGIGFPFLAAVASLAWLSGYRRLKRERARWARHAAGLAQTTARLMGP